MTNFRYEYGYNDDFLPPPFDEAYLPFWDDSLGENEAMEICSIFFVPNVSMVIKGYANNFIAMLHPQLFIDKEKNAFIRYQGVSFETFIKRALQLNLKVGQLIYDMMPKNDCAPDIVSDTSSWVNENKIHADPLKNLDPNDDSWEANLMRLMSIDAVRLLAGKKPSSLISEDDFILNETELHRVRIILQKSFIPYFNKVVANGKILRFDAVASFMDRFSNYVVALFNQKVSLIIYRHDIELYLSNCIIEAGSYIFCEEWEWSNFLEFQEALDIGVSFVRLVSPQMTESLIDKLNEILRGHGSIECASRVQSGLNDIPSFNFASLDDVQAVQAVMGNLHIFNYNFTEFLTKAFLEVRTQFSNVDQP